MLKAVVVMLDGCNKDKVECAKTILGELIIELEKEPVKKQYLTRSTILGQQSVDVVDEELDAEAIAAKMELEQ